MKYYSVLDVAKYIVKTCNNRGCSITNLRLQKILYFVQAQFISNNNSLCFIEEFECWTYGPVIPSVYSYFRFFGTLNIEINDFIHGDIENIEFSEEDKMLVDSIISKTKNMSTDQLIEITHLQDPWKMNYNPEQNMIIPNEDMLEYFSSRNQ